MKKFKYKDNLASKRRRNFNIQAGLVSMLFIVVVVGIGYALFYTPWFKVNTLTLEGLVDSHQDQVRQMFDQSLNHKILGIPIGRDIFFVRSGSLAADLTSQLPFIQSVSIQKDYFHTLKIIASERQAEGVWCFSSSSFTTPPDCRYFDHNGVTFGQAIQSSGVLLLNVDDMRSQPSSVSLAMVDPRFLKAIQTVAPLLASQDVKIKNINIPLGTYTEFDILTNAGYVIKFSLDSDIQNQVEIFRIFRTEKMMDGTLHPQYIDLRFDGRVYFK